MRSGLSHNANQFTLNDTKLDENITKKLFLGLAFLLSESVRPEMFRWHCTQIKQIHGWTGQTREWKDRPAHITAPPTP
jgi:hypothetical protein